MLHLALFILSLIYVFGSFAGVAYVLRSEYGTRFEWEADWATIGIVWLSLHAFTVFVAAVIFFLWGATGYVS